MAAKHYQRRLGERTSWDPVALEYARWVGQDGSRYHRKLAIPALLELVGLRPRENLLDIGAGSGVLAPYVHAAHAHYTGVDISKKLLQVARSRHRTRGTFLYGDACHLHCVAELRAGTFDVATFLLSIQDMDPLQEVLQSAAWALRAGGRLVILMLHPCFRVPRQSGWGWDTGRGLQYRRVDRYLTPLAVPVVARHRQGEGSTRSFHRPLEAYINALGESGMAVERIREVAAYPIYTAPTVAENTAQREIPVFLGVRAIKRSAHA